MALEELTLLTRELRSVRCAAKQELIPPGTSERARIVGDLGPDPRYGWRVLGKNPGFTAVAVLTLALAIGVNTTIFSLVSSMLLRKPPAHDPDRLVMLLSRNPGAGAPADEAKRLPVSAPDFLDGRAQATSYSGMAALSSDDMTPSGGHGTRAGAGSRVSADYFGVLGVPPVLGRAFVLAEDQAGREHVAVLREDLWKRRFGGDPPVISHPVKVDGENYTVIGIMGGGFRRMWLFPA